MTDADTLGAAARAALAKLRRTDREVLIWIRSMLYEREQAEADLARVTAERDEAQMEYGDCWHESDRLRADLAEARRLIQALVTEHALGYETSYALDDRIGDVEDFLARTDTQEEKK